MRSAWIVCSVLVLFACGDDTSATGGGGNGTGGQATGAGGPGGAATGGNGAGGAASGGAASGGNGGSGGQASGGNGTGGNGVVATAECGAASDCQLINDCCRCEVIPANETAPVCNQQCLIPSCQSLGFDGSAQCALGQCIAAFACDQTLAVCNQMPPTCPAGQTPMVVNGCWGGCVPATECASVSDCAQCGPEDACVYYGGGIMQRHCVHIPQECGTASCSCMGAMVCGNVTCGEAGGELQCQIP